MNGHFNARGLLPFSIELLEKLKFSTSYTSTYVMYELIFWQVRYSASTLNATFLESFPVQERQSLVF